MSSNLLLSHLALFSSVNAEHNKKIRILISFSVFGFWFLIFLADWCFIRLETGPLSINRIAIWSLGRGSRRGLAYSSTEDQFNILQVNVI